MSPYESYHRVRSKTRRLPTWLLCRREARIVATTFPSNEQLIELGAIRRELRIRRTRKARLWWWSL